MTLKIDVIKDKILSENYFVLRNITYDLTRNNGEVIRHKREVYDRGNGATILLYNREKQSVVLIRQFRVATWVNGNPDGRLIETCAGLLDDDEPDDCIRKDLRQLVSQGRCRKVYGGAVRIEGEVNRNVAERVDTLRPQKQAIAAIISPSRMLMDEKSR